MNPDFLAGLTAASLLWMLVFFWHDRRMKNQIRELIRDLRKNRPALRDSGSTTNPVDEGRGDAKTNPED